MVPLRMLSGYLTVTNYEKHRGQIREYLESLDTEKLRELEFIVTDVTMILQNVKSVHSASRDGSRTGVL